MRFRASVGPAAQALGVGSQGSDGLHPFDQVGLLGDRAVAWNYGVKIELEGAFDGLVPYDDGAAGAVIDERGAAVDEEVTRVYLRIAS